LAVNTVLALGAIQQTVDASKRKYGFHVLPFLFEHKLIARVDLKADRANKRLLVIGKWFEQRKTAATAAALSTELRALGHWLGLSPLMNQSSRKASGCD
jgi:uncharacterized protein YcaQ